MKRSLFYQQKTIKELFAMYADENNRINREDAENTQKHIVNEMYERLNKVFRVLDSGEAVNVESLYNEFLQAATKERV